MGRWIWMTWILNSIYWNWSHVRPGLHHGTNMSYVWPSLDGGSHFELTQQQGHGKHAQFSVQMARKQLHSKESKHIPPLCVAFVTRHGSGDATLQRLPREMGVITAVSVPAWLWMLCGDQIDIGSCQAVAVLSDRLVEHEPVAVVVLLGSHWETGVGLGPPIEAVKEISWFY